MNFTEFLMTDGVSCKPTTCKEYYFIAGTHNLETSAEKKLGNRAVVCGKAADYEGPLKVGDVLFCDGTTYTKAGS